MEVQWLVRRAFCRSLGEPALDGLHEPQALVFERNGAAVFFKIDVQPVISDGVMALDRQGALDQHKQIVCSFLFGSPEFYEWVAENPRLRMAREW